MSIALFERFPGTATLPRAGIAELPTPVGGMVGVVTALGGEMKTVPMRALFVKRDDLTSSAYGGNKVRKLDFLLGEALSQGAKSVITFGAYGSNHALATAVHARALGLEPHVVLSPQEPGPYAPATLLAHARVGTKIHLADGWDGRREAVLARQELTERDGVAPYVIPMGGTNALGAVGYVNAALEILGQAHTLSLGVVKIPLSDFTRPDVAYVAAGTLGTAVGLALGFAAGGAETRTVAIRVTPSEICNLEIADNLVAETVALLRSLDPSFPELTLGDLAFELREEWFEPGYGVVTPETESAVETAAGSRLKLETTYTGKAFAALLGDARAGQLERERVLFLDTYSSAPKPAGGYVEALPQELQDYILECESIYGVHE